MGRKQPTYKFSLVKWQKFTQPKDQRALGVRNLKLHNKSFLLKWLWRFGQNEAGYWGDIIKAKHDILDHWILMRSGDTHGVGVWKDISSLQDDFFLKVFFKAGYRLKDKILARKMAW